MGDAGEDGAETEEVEAAVAGVAEEELGRRVAGAALVAPDGVGATVSSSFSFSFSVRARRGVGSPTKGGFGSHG